MHGATFGMAVKAGVESANTQGLYGPDDVQARIVEILEIITTLAPEYDVDLSAPAGSNASGSGLPPSFEGVPTFTVDNTTWYDFRDAKAAKIRPAGHPDFKTLDGDGIWEEDRDGNTNPDAIALVRAADVAKALV